MKILQQKIFLFACLLMGFGLSAQQLEHPMLVEVNSPSNLAGSYIYGFQSDWGPTSLAASVTGEAVWARTAVGDSISCDSVVNDLTGKIALVRRGACNFSLKALNAQTQGAVGCVICNSQPGGGVINMAGGTFGASVTIPTVMLSYEDCELLANAITAGDSVSMTFRKPAIANAVGTFAYGTPEEHIQVLDGINVDVINASASAASATVTAIVTDPAGATQTLMDTLTIAADTTVNVTFTQTYTPVDTGMYQMAFFSSLANDTVFENFRITEHSFMLDEGDEDEFTWIGVTDQGFADAAYRFDMGNAYIAGPNGGSVAWASFALDNGSEFIGRPFNILLYDITGATGQDADYSTYTPVAATQHIITAADTLPNTIITERLFDINSGADSAVLTANTQYLLVVQYQGDSTIPTSPRFTYGGTGEFISLGSTVYTDRFYPGGFTGGYRPVIRLHQAAFMSGTAVTPVAQLDQNSLAVFPNPAKDYLNIQLSLEEQMDAQISLIDIRGQRLQEISLNGAQHQTEQININELPAGVYFIRLATSQGFTVKQFIKQ